MLVARGTGSYSARIDVPGLKSVDLAVGGNQCRFTLLAIDGLAVLHPNDPLKALAVNVLEHAPVVDLTGRRLVPSRNVANLEIGDLVPRGIDVRNDVALRDLLVIDVEQDLARGAADRFADHVGLRNLGKEHAGMIEEVQRFQHHDETVRLKDCAGLL